MFGPVEPGTVYTHDGFMFFVLFLPFPPPASNVCVCFLEYLHLKSAIVYLLCINRGARCDEVCSPAIHIPS